MSELPKFCIELGPNNKPNGLLLMVDDPKADEICEAMAICFVRYLPGRDMDAYSLTPSEAVEFISRYFALEQSRIEPTRPAKRSLTPKQRAARRLNALKATRARIERQQHTDNIRIDRGVS